MFLAHFREVQKGKKKEEWAPHTRHHAHSLLEVEPTAAALALPAVLAHDAALPAFLAPTWCLISEEVGWTVSAAGALVGQEVTWEKEQKKGGSHFETFELTFF